jgi:hypothetical protein
LGVDVMASHIVVSALFRIWSGLPDTGLALDVDIEFDLLIGLDLTLEHVRTLPVVKIILHSLVASAKRRFGRVSIEAEAIPKKLDKKSRSKSSKIVIR